MAAIAISHEELLNHVVDRLKNHAASKTLFGGRIIKTGEPLPASGPYAVVKKGKFHGVPKVSAAALGQADVKVTIWTEDKELLPTLTVSAQTSLNGWLQSPTDGPIRGVVLTDTGKASEEDGLQTRTDTFAVFYDPRPVETPVSE